MSSLRAVTSAGPKYQDLAEFLAAQLGTDAETVIRWLVTLLVLLIDPTAVVLTIAATIRREV